MVGCHHHMAAKMTQNGLYWQHDARVNAADSDNVMFLCFTAFSLFQFFF